MTRFAPGDEVYGVAPGSFAQYVVADVNKLATKPAALSYTEAAVVPISAGTALQAVRDVATVTSGQSVLITGASGGVGSYAVQLAVAAGAEVTAVCSLPKRDHVTDLGAHHVVGLKLHLAARRVSVTLAEGARAEALTVDLAALRRAGCPTAPTLTGSRELVGVAVNSSGVRPRCGGCRRC